MRLFARLYAELDASTATLDKLAALQRYFGAAPPHDAAWAVYFLAGGKPRQVMPTAVMRQVALDYAGISEWLFEECYQAVGDLAETIAHVLPVGAEDDRTGLAEWVEQRLLGWRDLSPAEQALRLREAWQGLDAAGRFLLIKLIGGGFRVGVSKLLVQRALALWSGLDAKLIAQRMMGWTDARATPSAERFLALVSSETTSSTDAGQPYPFFLAHALQQAPETLGEVSDWLVEWKYDGIRAQLIKRERQQWLWSRGEELISERFPEVLAVAAGLPDGTVLDGELLAWLPGATQPAPFQLLQQRITRKTLTKKVLADVPVRFLAYDLLESAGEDRRGEPQWQRRERLESLLADSPLRISPRVLADDWPQFAALRESARQRSVEGFMLKRLDSRYGSGRTKAEGLWWKWKVDPLAVDCVLIYAQAGHGRRASVYTDYTFAVWSRAPHDAAEAQAVIDTIARREPALPEALQLVPFAKAYSGLSDDEFAAVSRVVRDTTLEKFGPVRSVKPTLVFELGFEGIGASARHKSGIAVRFPRMLRIRNDKPLHEADTLDTLRGLIRIAGHGADIDDSDA